MPDCRIALSLCAKYGLVLAACVFTLARCIHLKQDSSKCRCAVLVAVLRQSTVSIVAQCISSVDGQADNYSWEHIFPEATAKATYTILFQEEDAALVDIVRIQVQLAYIARVHSCRTL